MTDADLRASLPFCGNSRLAHTHHPTIIPEKKPATDAPSIFALVSITNFRSPAADCQLIDWTSATTGRAYARQRHRGEDEGREGNGEPFLKMGVTKYLMWNSARGGVIQGIHRAQQRVNRKMLVFVAILNFCGDALFVYERKTKLAMVVHVCSGTRDLLLCATAGDAAMCDSMGRGRISQYSSGGLPIVPVRAINRLIVQ